VLKYITVVCCLKDNLKWFLFLVTYTSKIIVCVALGTYSNGHLHWVCQLIPDNSILRDIRVHVRKAWWWRENMCVAS